MCSNSRKYRVLDVQMPAQYYDVYITVRISLSGSSGGAFMRDLRQFDAYVAHPCIDRYRACGVQCISVLAGIEKYIMQHLPFVECVSFAAGGEDAVCMRFVCRTNDLVGDDIARWFSWSSHTLTTMTAHGAPRTGPDNSHTAVVDDVLRHAFVNIVRCNVCEIIGCMRVDSNGKPVSVHVSRIREYDQHVYDERGCMRAAQEFGPRMSIELYRDVGRMRLYRHMLVAMPPSIYDSDTECEPDLTRGVVDELFDTFIPGNDVARLYDAAFLINNMILRLEAHAEGDTRRDSDDGDYGE